MLRPFVFAIALTILVVCPADARVGVTSQTDGDPLGKPPTQAERVLRVGIDIQANEVVTTRSDDRAHIVFLDGTALTVAPNAQLVIDKFVYDPDRKRGELAVSVTTGVFRLVGGKISKTSAIVVNTPSATMGLRGGIGLFVVTAQETKAHFLYGISLAVTAGGRTEIATRAGSQIIAKLGNAPTAPAIAPNGAMAEALRALEGRSAASGSTAADEETQKSGFSAHNSERGVDGRSGPLEANRAGDASQPLSEADRQRAFGTTSSSSGGAAPAPFLAGTPSSGSAIGSPVSGPVTAGPTTSIQHRATPAIGVGNGGLVPAIPARPHGK